MLWMQRGNGRRVPAGAPHQTAGGATTSSSSASSFQGKCESAGKGVISNSLNGLHRGWGYGQLAGLSCPRGTVQDPCVNRRGAPGPLAFDGGAVVLSRERRNGGIRLWRRRSRTAQRKRVRLKSRG